MEDVQQEAWHICNILAFIDKAITASYLIRQLKGINLTKANSGPVDSVGKLRDMESDRIRCLIRYLGNQGFLQRVGEKTGSMILTEKGQTFHKSPYPIILYPRQLSQNKYEREVYSRLRQLRKNICKEEGCPAYIIYSDFTLEELSFRRPQNLTQLAGIPGMGDIRINRYGPAILNILKDVRNKQKLARKEELAQLVQRPSFKEVKAMFEAGMTISEMAERREVKESSIFKMLSDLYEAREIDLSNFIEAEIPAETLQRGKTYFESQQASPLNMAFKELGIGYETLRLCRLYVSRFSQCEEAWELEY